MACCDLRECIRLIAGSGELRRITVEVDPRLEIAAITDRVCKQNGGGAALLFENVAGSRIPVLTNLFGSQIRIATLLRISEIDALSGIMSEFLEHGGVEPHHVSRTLCRETVTDSPSCDHFPITVDWPGNGMPTHAGRFITLGQVVTREYSGNRQNLGIYRIACFSGSELGISWRKASGAAAHHTEWSAAGEPMPVAVVLGGDPAVTIAAMTPIPSDLDELALAGALRRSSVPVCRALTGDLVIPAEAEIVIEGVVDPFETRNEGCFGNYTGGYAGGGEIPLLRVTSVSSRRNPIFPSLVAGPPPCENVHLAFAISRMIKPLALQGRSDLPAWPSLFNDRADTSTPTDMLTRPPGLEELVDRRWREYGFTDDK